MPPPRVGTGGDTMDTRTPWCAPDTRGDQRGPVMLVAALSSSRLLAYIISLLYAFNLKRRHRE